MREILYISEQKVNSVFMDARRLDSGRRRVIEGTLGLPSIAGGKVSVEKSGAEGESGPWLLAQKLERIIDYLDRRRPVEFISPKLQNNQWVTFDLNMVAGTSHRDGAPSPEDDVALFGGTSTSDPVGDNRPVDLLLCGSLHHLKHRIGSHGRMGSDTEWLHKVIISLEDRQSRGVDVVPEFLTQLVPHRSSTEPEQQVRWVFDALLRSNSSHLELGRLKGHARVLMNSDGPRWRRRLVLATPLYVEIPAPELPARRWRW